MTKQTTTYILQNLILKSKFVLKFEGHRPEKMLANLNFKPCNLMYSLNENLSCSIVYTYREGQWPSGRSGRVDFSEPGGPEFVSSSRQPHSGVARGQGDICPRRGTSVPGRRARGAHFWGARTFFARQLVQEENMGHSQFWEFRCSVQCPR